MGFDLVGQNGQDFRNNVWWWRPLWDYVCEHCDLSEKAKQSGNYNDGYLIDKDTAIHIADTLDRLIESGHAKKTEQSYVKDTAPKRNFNKFCEKAASVFYEKIVDKQQDKITCPGDMKTVDPESYKIWSTLMFDLQYNETSYPFEEANVKEFAKYCRESGGFQIY